MSGSEPDVSGILAALTPDLSSLSAVINLIAIGLLVLFAIRGWARGLVQALISIAGFILAFYAGAHFAPMTGDLFGVETSTGVYYGAAFLIIFILVNVGAYYLGSFLKDALSAASLGMVDRIGGALFGAAKWLMVIAVLSLPISMLLPDDWARAYREAPAIRIGLSVGGTIYETVEPLVSEDVERFVDEARSIVRRQMNRASEAASGAAAEAAREAVRNRVREYTEELSE